MPTVVAASIQVSQEAVAVSPEVVAVPQEAVIAPQEAVFVPQQALIVSAVTVPTVAEGPTEPVPVQAARSDLDAVSAPAASDAAVSAQTILAEVLAQAARPVPVLPPAEVMPEVMPEIARVEAPDVAAHPPLTLAAWTGAIAALDGGAEAAGHERLDPATWLAGIMALAGAERPEPSRLDLVRGPRFQGDHPRRDRDGRDRSAA